jgi:hypothetical protein
VEKGIVNVTRGIKRKRLEEKITHPFLLEKYYIDSLYRVVPNKKNVPSLSAVIDLGIKKFRKEVGKLAKSIRREQKIMDKMKGRKRD